MTPSNVSRLPLAKFVGTSIGRRYTLTDGERVKLCVIDTGDGMTGEEMVRYINRLSASISTQCKTGNFGVGAKISAAPLNHEGLVYPFLERGKGQHDRSLF